MNLELLDPFRKQIPDRVDATLNLPSVLHFHKKIVSNEKQPDNATSVDTKKADDDDEDWKAANHVAFNRRGTYIAVGYGSGTVGVYDVLSRTLSGLYRNETSSEDDDDEAVKQSDAATSDEGTNKNATTGYHGVTSVSWSRRSRTLLAGAAGSADVRLIDTTHPFGPEECCLGITIDPTNKDTSAQDEEQSSHVGEIEEKRHAQNSSSFVKPKTTSHDHFKTIRTLKVKEIGTSKEVHQQSSKKVATKREFQSHIPVSAANKKRYPSIRFQLPVPVGSSVQVHPRDNSAGFAGLTDGSMVAFWAPNDAWEEGNNEDDDPPEILLTTIFKDEAYDITCAAFDPHGEKIYAATKDGKLLGFEVAPIYDSLAARARGSKGTKEQKRIPALKPDFTIQIPGGATAWHLIVSRNGRYLVINSADAAIRLYTTKECWTTPEEVEKPTWVFQDVVSKVKFASCDISGDGEFVVGGSNQDENKYELYIWNTSTGTLMDKLTGSTVELYSVAWHPTRSFLAVAASDGLVDVWGPRINWTAFAPDFQALPHNVEYVECEDEFDIVDDKKESEPKKEEEEEENVNVDVLTIEAVPVFASDSEDEEDVFHFGTKVTRLLGAITS